jgi:glycolate oxidase FAD binding subunit
MVTLAIHSEADLVDAVRGARAQKRTLEIMGGGTKRGFGRPIESDDVLDCSGLAGIIAYEPEELVLTAKAGTTLAEIESTIAGKQQRLGFSPADWGPLFGGEAGKSTIAGALSADTSGSARVRYGAARDHLLGFKAANGFGEAYKGGGRVVKNVTGFDLPKLMCGAMGTLSVLSEVTLRLVPRASHTLTLAVRDIVPDDGLAMLRKVWMTPLEATGLAYVPACAAEFHPALGSIGAGAALLRIEGAAEPLDEKRIALRAIIDGHEALELPEGDAFFDGLAAGSGFVARDTDLWRICVPPSEATATADALVGTIWYADWAGGLFWVAVSAIDGAAAGKLRHIAARADGHATLLRASSDLRMRVPVFPPENEVRASLTRAVKSAFDPDGLFNPGRMGV